MKLKSRLCFGLYATLTTLLLPLGVAYLCWKKRRDPPYGKRVCELFGHNTLELKQCIWFHTVSVGEVIAARPVIRAFVNTHPKYSIIVTTTTTSGALEAEKIDGITHIFAPLDSPFAVQGFLKSFNPTHLFIMETELWPCLLHYTKKFGTKITVFNARMPETTCQSYLRFRTFTRDLIASKLDLVICQTKQDANRFVRIGVDADLICISNSLKYDLHPDEDLFRTSRQIRNSWGKDVLVLGAISTHSNEEELVIETFYSLREKYPKLKLILVPRHRSSAEQAKIFLEEIHGSFQSRTSTARDLSDFHSDILLGNTMGEIEFYLGLCDVVFMGGSLVDVGGHNPLEPAFFSLPIITGPSYYNFDEQYETLIDRGGAYVANDHRRLYTVCQMLFDDPELALTTGIQALDVQQKGRGALERTLNYIDEVLMPNPNKKVGPQHKMLTKRDLMRK